MTMDRQTVDTLRAVTAAFYKAQHASFAQSRQSSCHIGSVGALQ